jgi:periplasmic protein TonB
MTPIPLPTPLPSLPLNGDHERGSPTTRRALVAGVLGAHVLGAWGLLQVESVRQAVGEVAPLMVDLITPLTSPPTPTPKTIPANGAAGAAAQA